MKKDLKLGITENLVKNKALLSEIFKIIDLIKKVLIQAKWAQIHDQLLFRGMYYQHDKGIFEFEVNQSSWS